MAYLSALCHLHTTSMRPHTTPHHFHYIQPPPGPLSMHPEVETHVVAPPILDPHAASQATSQAMTAPRDKCLPNVAHTHHSCGPPSFSHAHCTIFCLLAHSPTAVLLQAMSTARSSTLSPTLACLSAQLPGTQSYSPVHPATHLVCEPYVPLMHGVSQAPSMCLPPSSVLLAPHSLPASPTPPPSHLHMTLHHFYHIWPPQGPLCMCPALLHEPPQLSYAIPTPHRHVPDYANMLPPIPTCTHTPQSSPGPQPQFGHVQMRADAYLHVLDLVCMSSHPLLALQCASAPPYNAHEDHPSEWLHS